jgi:hypothetical protein
VSDEQKKSDGGWEWELKQAEAAIASAPGGSPELARGVYLQAQAIRNMFMGDIGQSYVNSLETAVGRGIGAAIAPLTSEVSGLRTEVAMRLQKIDERVDAVVVRLDRKRDVLAAYGKRLDDHDVRLDTFETKVAADIQSRLEILEAENVRLSSENSRLAAVEQASRDLAEAFHALAARIGGALPTEADQDLSAELRRASHGT